MADEDEGRQRRGLQREGGESERDREGEREVNKPRISLTAVTS